MTPTATGPSTHESSAHVYAPPPHPTAEQIEASARRHYLFGYPISHSASPAFQNLLIQRSAANKGLSLDALPTYSLYETRSIDEAHMRALVRGDAKFGGAGVTMPLKVAVTKQLGPEHILDELDEVASATSTVNTIVCYPGGRRVGTNTDYLGIRCAILRSVAVQNGLAPAAYMSSMETSFKFPPDGRVQDGSLPHSALIIGSGGTCRSAVWAAHQLGLSPLYLLNRDAAETQDVVQHFTDKNLGIDLRPLRSEAEWQREAELRQQGHTGNLACCIGAIPAYEPVSPEEKMVYTLAHAFFRTAYVETPSTAAAPQGVSYFTLPALRPFLEMCYKPRLTPLLHYASTEGERWAPIGGVEAMVEQGLAQARMWAASEPILRGEAPLRDPLSCATAASDAGPLGLQAEEDARRMAVEMRDVVVPATQPVVVKSVALPTPAVSQAVQ